MQWTPLALAQQALPPGFRSYPLQHRKAEDIVPQLRNLLEGTADPERVLVDTQLNRILVEGPDASQKLTAQFVEALDQPMKPIPEVRTTPIPEVKGYRAPTKDLQALAAKLQQQYATQPGVRVTVDPSTRQVIVVAPAAIQSEVQQQLQNLAEGTTGAPMPSAATVDVRRVLQHITWRELEDHLRQVWGSRLTMPTTPDGNLTTVGVATPTGSQSVLTIDHRQNLVQYVGPQGGEGAWLHLVQSLDKPKIQAGDQTRIVPVSKADPAKIQTAISLIQAAAAGTRGDMTTAVKALGTAQNDARWGGNLVSTIFQQDEPATAQAPAAPQNAAPQNAAPQNTAPQDAAPQDAAPQDAATGPTADEVADEGGLIGPVEIEFLEGLDVLVLRGNKRDVQRVMKIIEDIERLSDETQPQVEVYRLQHVDCEALYDLISELYEEILSTRQGQVAMRALVQPNALLLIGRKESVEVVKELIAKLDQPAEPASRFIVIRLKYISAADAETTVREFFVNKPGSDEEERGGLGTRVRVIAEYRTNTLIVQAGVRDLSEVQRLVSSIDIDDPEASSVIRVFRLRNALAEDLAEVLQDAITGQTTSGQNNQQSQSSTPPSTALEFMMVDQEGGRLLRSGILANAQVTADSNVNALVVRAPAKSMELIEALVKELDQMPDVEAQIKVFTVVNGDATSLAGMLQQLFGQDVTVGSNQTTSTLGNLFGSLNQQQMPTVSGPGDSSLVPLRFTVDTRTNSIVASGSDADLSVVEALLLRLDESGVGSRQLSVIRLKNAPAADVATTISDFLQQQRQNVELTLYQNQAISAFEQVDREVIVVAEEVTNSLIVSATERYHDEIMRIIKELDFRPPMVMVQVLIAEVQLDDTFEFGVQWGLQDSLLFNRGGVGTDPDILNPGYNFGGAGLPNYTEASSGALLGQQLVDLGVGRSSSALGYGGLVLSAASDSVNMLLRALQDEGRVQILSRPQIMTLNNQEAFVQVGATQSRINGSTISQGIVTNQVTDVETGLILRILPLINDDGVVVMNLDAERSRLGDTADGVVVATDQNGQPIIAPPIERTTAQTTVSARSGQTVVFAGLITKSRAVAKRRVPYLSDIPVVGKAFEFKTDIDQRTELLIVMTPYIVQDDEDYEFIKMMESERMSWCLGDITEVHGDVGLQGYKCLFCEDDVPCLFPCRDPMGTQMWEQTVPYTDGELKETSDAILQDVQGEDPELEPMPVSSNSDLRQRQPPQYEIPATHMGPVPKSGSETVSPTSVTYGPQPAGASSFSQLQRTSATSPITTSDAHSGQAVQAQRLPAVQ